jgi:hypothetical protein
MEQFDKHDLEILQDCINHKHYDLVEEIAESTDPMDVTMLKIELSDLARVSEKLYEQLHGVKVVVTLS